MKIIYDAEMDALSILFTTVEAIGPRPAISRVREFPAT
jgi:hypothetical protein